MAADRTVQKAVDRLLDVDEAATMLGMAPATLYKWAHERRLPTVKLGSALRFRLSEIEKLIRRAERPALRSMPLTSGNV